MERLYRLIVQGQGVEVVMQQHRPITLLSVLGKVFAQILLLRNELLKHRQPQQAGFATGHSTADIILALRLLTEVHRKFNRPLYIGYVDLKFAFDSVDPRALWKAVRGVGA